MDLKSTNGIKMIKTMSKYNIKLGIKQGLSSTNENTQIDIIFTKKKPQTLLTGGPQSVPS